MTDRIMKYVGVDGCKRGWFAVAVSNRGDWETGVFGNICDLWENHRDAAVILVDIPIGLKDSGPQERECDRQARRILKNGRTSCVFRVPCRQAVCSEMNEVSFTNFQVTGKYLSIETLAILHKIREVEELLSRDRSARSVIRETHPEICFWALSRGLGLKHPKKKKEGFIERKDLLQTVFPMTADIVEHALKSYLRKNVGKDDILDALANVATARLGFGKFKTFPEVPPKDSTGLPMEMVYF